MRRVLGIPAFRRLAAVSMTNELALSIGVVALAVLIYQQTGSALGAMAYFLCTQFAPALISPVLVTRLELRDAQRLIPVLCVIEGIVFILLAWLVAHFVLSIVLALAFLDATLAITSRVLVRATWTTLTMPRELFREASAVMNSAFSVLFMVGPGLGGALVALWGVRGALLVNAGVFAVSALTILTARGLPRPAGTSRTTGGSLKAGLSYARAQPLIRRLLGLEAVAILFFTISIPVEVVLAEHSFKAGPGGYGALLAAWGGGTIGGSAIYARWRKLRSRALITLGTCLLGAGFLVMAIAPTLTVAMVGAAIGGIGNGIQIVAFRTSLQEAATTGRMALIVSLNESVFQGMAGAGIVLGGALAALGGPRFALAVGAVGALAVATALWRGLRVAEAAPSEPADVEGDLRAVVEQR